jgi:molecular chaperone DnaK
LMGASTEKGDMLLLDVTPHNLGIMIAGGYFQTLITANSTVPTSATHVFTTVRDDQTAVKIVVLQGESDIASQNELLGEFLLSGLPPLPRGSIEVDVRFDISPDGIVSVAARDRGTGLERGIQVTATNRLSEEDLQRMVKENDAFAVQERNTDALAALRSEVEALVRDIDRLLPSVANVIGKADFGDDALKKANVVVDRARRGLLMNDLEALRGSKEPLERTVILLQGIATRVDGRNP